LFFPFKIQHPKHQQIKISTMKKILFIATIFVSLSLIASSVSAQTFYNRNAGQSIIKTKTTTNNTATTVYTVPTTSNEVGFITIKAIGFSAADTAAVTGIRTYRYTKVGGTLTLASVTETLTPVADSDISGATFAAVASSNDILVKVTGVSSKTIYWNVITQQTATKLD